MIYDPEFSINEEAIFSKDNKNPIYIVLSSGSSPLAKAIKKVTKSEFSHAMISFNSKLDPLYSFGTKAGGKGLGFVINNPKDVVWNIDDCKYSVYVMYVNDKAYNLMKNRLKFFTDNKDKLKYDFRGLIDIWRGIESDTRTQKWFCSRFVMEIINSALPLSKVPSLWKPVDILNLDNISLVNRGFNFYNYNYKVTERHCNDIKRGKYNVGDVIYEGISSTVVKDYSSKRDMFLSNFTRMKLSDAVIQTYKAKYPSLSHVRINKNTKGYCWLDEDKLVATINTEIKDDDDYVWINAFEIFGEYKGHGLSKQILRFAIKDLNITHLSVNKKNEVAIKLYKSLGFNTYRESENMLFMSIHSKINESSDAVSTVYFTRNITPQSLCKIYRALNHPLIGNVGVKISTGEYGGHNYLKPELIKDLVEEVNGTILECNTAYKGSRNTSKAHWDTIKKHGFTKIAKVDLMDEFGEITIPVKNGYHLKENIVGKSITDYNSIIMLNHFKGHTMAGYGGALKNMSIGMASSRGKIYIHTSGKGGDMMKADRTQFLESMVDADSAIMGYMNRDNIIYINVANNLSVDCDCDPHPHKPEIPDIGIFASTDPVAVDQACIDSIYNMNDPKKQSLIKRIETRNGIHTIECAEKKGLGSRKYNIIDIDEFNLSNILQESDIDDYKKYIVNGSEYYLEIMYEKMYKQYHYKTPLVGFPTDSRKEYLEFEADTIAAANNYYTFKISDANKDYPFKFFNILDIPKNKYMELINEHVPMAKRKDANLYHVNIVDNKRKISTILVAIPNTIYATYLLLPNNVLYKFDHERKLYQESAFCSNDYRESAVLAVDKLKQLHDIHEMMNIDTIDIVRDDGKWIFAEYSIDNEADKDNVVRFTNFINQIIKTSIYEGCIEPPTNYKSHGFLSISEKSIYDMVQTEGTKFYKNPAQQLKKKNTIKKNDQIKKGKYSVQTLSEKNKNESSDVDNDIEYVAEYARKLLTKEIFECKDCAYVYKDIMKPYAKDNSFAVIGWDSNSLKADDINSFDKCRNAVYGYCKKIFEDVKKDYTLEADDTCFYVCKK